jgi:diguanylate cyclase (GGDEF)-like protein
MVDAEGADPWAAALGELRRDFVQESRAKVAAMRELRARLAADPSDAAALRDLHRRFHGFAGTGASYGFPEVSRIGSQGERDCLSLLGRGAAPAPEDLLRWRELEDELVAELSQEAEPAAPPSVPAPASAPRMALVADDDQTACRVAVRVLEQEGLEVRVATSREEALALLERMTPDVAFIDVNLPDGSGCDLVEAIRGKAGGDAPAILVISSRNDFQDRIQAATAGADGYFEKPVDWDGVLRRLHIVLERTRTEPARVLSVEDDAEEAAFLRTVLESGGYRFRACADPSRFEADLAAFDPDLVLMDVNLPGCTGYDLVRYLRQSEKHATLPILFLTTEAAQRAHLESARAGGDDHLVKPVAPGLLLATVAARVERARFVKSLLERDGLTRLYTHTVCQERAKSLAAQVRRDPSRRAAWVMVDVDHFKSINDRYGHPTGDKVLTALAAFLRRRLRQSDTVARYGGEEFVILLEEVSEEQAVRLVARLLGEFAQLAHVGPGGVRFTATFSAGVALLEAGAGVEVWKQAADDALYRAKQGGRHRVVGVSGFTEGLEASPSTADGGPSSAEAVRPA